MRVWESWGLGRGRGGVPDELGPWQRKGVLRVGATCVLHRCLQPLPSVQNTSYHLTALPLQPGPTHGPRPCPRLPWQVWGLDFGDCHRSLFAHSDAVMGVAFVPKTHYAFTVGKDKLLKYWDVDRWVRRANGGWAKVGSVPQRLSVGRRAGRFLVPTCGCGGMAQGCGLQRCGIRCMLPF